MQLANCIHYAIYFQAQFVYSQTALINDQSYFKEINKQKFKKLHEDCNFDYVQLKTP